jgi:protein-S-isoprenylcysteine O-methyltransferase Ste14
LSAALARWSFFAFFAAFAVVERLLTRSSLGSRSRGDRDPFTFLLFFVLPPIGIWIWMALLHKGVVPYRPTWLLWAIGVAFALAGFGVRIAGKRTLGRFFTIRVQLQEGHELVQEGMYASIRHPLYTGFLLAWCAPPFLFGSPIGLCFVTLPMLFAVVRRIPREEALLVEAFGDRYRDYMGRTNRLIPGVW